MATNLSDDAIIAKIKATLQSSPRMHTLMCAALMEMAAEQITKEAVEEDRDSV